MRTNIFLAENQEYDWPPRILKIFMPNQVIDVKYSNIRCRMFHFILSNPNQGLWRFDQTQTEVLEGKYLICYSLVTDNRCAWRLIVKIFFFLKWIQVYLWHRFLRSYFASKMSRIHDCEWIQWRQGNDYISVQTKKSGQWKHETRRSIKVKSHVV